VRDLVRRFGAPRFAVRWAVAPPDEGFATRFGLPAIACFPQSGADLGARMQAAFRAALDRAPATGRCVLIGSDMPQLRIELVEEAFARLADVDLVLGPAEDGGYYLIAMREPHDVFRNVAWSSPTVLDDTLAQARELGLAVALLEPGFDVDEPSDLDRLQRLLAGPGAAACPETARELQRACALRVSLPGSRS
jgi:rSAM/selenodomain-associated transferase 1